MSMDVVLMIPTPFVLERRSMREALYSSVMALALFTFWQVLFSVRASRFLLFVGALPTWNHGHAREDETRPFASAERKDMNMVAGCTYTICIARF